MRFDLFMGGLAVTLATLTTWRIILFFHPPTPSESVPEETLQGLSTSDTAPDNHSAAIDTHDDRQTPGTEQRYHHRTPRGEEISSQISRITRLLILATVLTAIVFIPSLLNHYSHTLALGWMVNPWAQAVISTPTMFLCGTPIHHRGWQALRHRTPDVNLLISLGTTATFIYSLAICIAGGQFPAGSRHAYFIEVNAMIALALAIELVELHILRDIEMLHRRTVDAGTGRLNAATDVVSNDGKPISAAHAAAQSLANRAVDTFVSGINKLAHFTRTFVIVVLIIAVWTFAVLLAFGPQPRLTFALSGGVGVLVIAGFALAISTLVLIANGRRKARHDSNK